MPTHTCIYAHMPIRTHAYTHTCLHAQVREALEAAKASTSTTSNVREANAQLSMLATQLDEERVKAARLGEEVVRQGAEAAALKEALVTTRAEAEEAASQAEGLRRQVSK